MKTLKNSVKKLLAVTAGTASLFILSAADTGVSAKSAVIDAAELEGTATGIAEYSFTEELTDLLEITLTAKEIEIDNGAEFNVLDYIEEITDAVENAVILNITGEVDTSENDSYTVTYDVTDLNGNTDTETLSVTVRYSEEQLREIAEREAAEKAAAEEAARKAEEEARQAQLDSQASYGNVSLSSLGVYDSGSAYAMIEAINAVRASYGLYAYSYASSAGFDAAAIRAQECTYYLSHTRPNGSAYNTALDECGVSYGYDSEIIAAYGSSIEANLNWWLSDAGHRNIVLGTSGSTIAAGYAGGVWVAEVY